MGQGDIGGERADVVGGGWGSSGDGVGADHCRHLVSGAVSLDDAQCGGLHVELRCFLGPPASIVLGSGPLAVHVGSEGIVNQTEGRHK